jgi:hypothetical protein
MRHRLEDGNARHKPATGAAKGRTQCAGRDGRPSAAHFWTKTSFFARNQSALERFFLDDGARCPRGYAAGPGVEILSKRAHPMAQSRSKSRRKRKAHFAPQFTVGDHVSWNSEAGRVRGTIVRVHTKDVDYKGDAHHASKDMPQYESKSDKTDHIALHKSSALRRIG